MAQFDTYDQLGGQAEDVQDAVYNISPVDAPVVSMARSIRATGKVHEWIQDKLIAPAANAAVEGADAPADASQSAVNKSNYCQIFTKTAAVSGTLEGVDKYGRDSEVAYQLEMRYREIVNDEELAVNGAPGGTRQTAVPGDGSTARKMAALVTQLDASVIVDATAYTLVSELEAGILSAHKVCFDAGGDPTYMVMDSTNSLYVSDFARAAGRYREFQDDNRRLTNTIDMYISNFGSLEVIIDRNSDDAIKLLDFNYLATPVLRATTDWELAKIGDSIRRQVLREGTFAVLNDKACAVVDSVPTDLTLT